MEKKLFVTEIAKALTAKKELVVNKVIKNNSTELTGISLVSDGEDNTFISPVVYVENYYEMYEEDGCNLQEVCEKIIEDLKAVAVKPECSSKVHEFFMDWERVRGHVHKIAVNASRNQEVLDNCPNIQEHGIAFLYEARIALPNGTASARVSNDMMAHWGITMKELEQVARENQKPPLIMNIKDMMVMVIMEQTGITDEDIVKSLIPDVEAEAPTNLFVVTNDEKMKGAALGFDVQVLSDACEMLETDELIILPSSIHEVIITPIELGVSVADMASMVREINEAEVSETDFLSDNVFLYRKGEGISIVG